MSKRSPIGSPSAEDRARFREAYRMLTQALALLERCERCGVDVGDRREIASYLVDRYQRYAQEFGLGEDTQQ